MSASKRIVVFVGAVAVLSLGLAGHRLGSCRLVYNPSASAPIGWYWVSSARSFQVDDYVLADLSPAAKKLADQRSYLPKAVPILKRVGAISDQLACMRGRSLWIDGGIAAVVLSHDRMGRYLMAWQGCHVLGADELLLVSTDNSASFDSRYFGPIPIGNVIGRAMPLWIW